MRFLLVIFALVMIGCASIKTAKVENKQPKKTHLELIVVIENTSNIAKAKALAQNSSLLWKGLVIDNQSLKAALIKIPIDKKDFWIDHLQKSNIFSSINIKEDNTIELLKKEALNTLIKVVKGPCSGDCPVYEVVFFKDGKVFFYGLENVLIKGEKEFILSDLELEKVNLFFEKTTFSKYKSSYIDKATLEGFPATIITHQNKQVEIKLWKFVPIELAYAHEYLEEILLEKELFE